MLINHETVIDKDKRLEPIVQVVERSVNKIPAVFQELRDLSNLDEMEKYTESQAINMDDRIREWLRKMENSMTESGT